MISSAKREPNPNRAVMSRTLPPWLVAGLLLTMLIAVIEVFVGYILDIRSWGTLAPRRP